MSKEILVAAKEYTAKGFVIHPLYSPLHPITATIKSPGKQPILLNWSNRKHATDEELIKWFENTDNNIGLVCGKESDIIVLDFDHMLFFDDVFKGVNINTLSSGRTTGRGHAYFKYLATLKAQKKHDLGIEVLSDGNNAVLPPSIHQSGDVYKWSNPDAPIMIMPDIVFNNLMALFQTETELKQFLSKCRHCFRDVIKRKPDMHNAEGREYMLAVCTDLKAAGATDSHIKMFAKLMYGKDYDEARTLQEWRNIDASKTWKCETIKQKLPSYIDLDQCERCHDKKERYTKNKDAANTTIYKNNGAFDYIQRIKEKNPIYYDKTGQFWIWNESGYYEQIDNTEVLLILLKNVADPSIIQSKFKAELLTAAQLIGRDAKVKPLPNNWIHIQNGVYDIKTGELFEATPDYLFTEPIPHKLSNSEDTPTIDKLFSEWVIPEKVQLLYEIAAYCLYNGYPIHRMFVLLGRGRNGKGQYRDLIVNLVGHQNRSASTLEQLINSRFETARLYNKKVCTMGEINYALLDRTAILKMLSGGDPIPGEQKNKQPFEFVNTAKLLINTNSLPQTSDKTDAFYSRCIVVEFGRQFLIGKDIIETIPQAEYDNLLTKCLRILRELLDRGEFTNEGSIQDKEHEYERLSNPLTQFINLYYEPDVNGKVAAWRMMDDYVLYCSEKGFVKPHTKKKFNEMLKVNYEVDTENCYDDETKKNVNWSWVYGLKPKILHDLHNLHELSLNPSMRLSTEESYKSCNSCKNDDRSHTEKLQNSTILVLPESCKKTENTVTELPQNEHISLIRSKILELKNTFNAGVPDHVLFKALENSGADMLRVRGTVAKLVTSGQIMLSNNKGSQVYHWAGV